MARLTNRDATSDDFIICLGATVIVFVVYLVATALF